MWQDFALSLFVLLALITASNVFQTINPLSEVREFEYDAHNRLETLTEGNRTSSYRYDLAGNTREKGQANGDTICTNVDPLGRQSVITGPGASGSELYVYTHTFDLFSNLARIAETYPAGQLNNRTVTNTNDGADRLTVETVTGTNAVTTTYGFDRANNRTVRTIDDGTSETWRYAMISGLNRLDYAWIDSNGDEAWAAGEARRDYSYNNLGVMTAITGSEGDTTSQSFEYDYENRLLDVADTAASKDYTYSYDYRTRRVERDESLAGAATTELSFSGGLSVQEYDNAATSPTVEYIRGSDYGGGIGGILYTLRGSASSFKHYNSLGDVVAATDGNGALTYQAAYEAFARHGDTASSEEWTDGTSPIDRQQGNTKDEDSWGALNEGFRYRLLDEGVFMTPDPLGFVDGPNHFSYVQQSPWTYFDPLGLEKVLGIHVQGTTHPTKRFTAPGHSWNSIHDTDSPEKIQTVGGWPNGKTQDGAVNDKVDRVRDGEKTSGIQPDFSRYKVLSDEEYKAYEEAIGKPWDYDSDYADDLIPAPKENCSTSARDVWEDTTGEDLDADDYFGIDSPAELAESIHSKEKKDPTQHLAPKVYQKPEEPKSAPAEAPPPPEEPEQEDQDSE